MILVCSTTVLCDGSTVLCDGSTVLCDGSTVLCDGQLFWSKLSLQCHAVFVRVSNEQYTLISDS